MKLYAKCVTPVHVGSGKVLEPFDYYFHNGKLIVLNVSECLNRLYEIHPDAIEKYSRWINDIVQKIENAKQEAAEARRNRNRNKRMQHNHIISKLRKEFNLIEFCHNEINDSQLANEFINDSRYHLRVMYTLDKPRGSFQVRELIHNGFRTYVPGSSIKGALRTALAYRVIKNLDGKWLDILLNGKPNSNIQGIGKILTRIRNLANDALVALENGDQRLIRDALNRYNREQKNWVKKIGDEVEKVVFGCGAKTKIGLKYDDPKFDLLRLMKISDSMEEQFDLLGGYLMSFTYNRFKQGISVQPVQFCELIDENSLFSFDISFDLKLIDMLLKNNQYQLWIDFEEKFKQLFQIGNHSSLQELESKLLNSIFTALQEFSNAILEKEKNWLGQFSGDELSQLSTYFNKLSSAAGVFRLGFSSGWHSTTVGLALGNNPRLQEYLPEIIYAFNLDLIINQKKLLARFSPREDIIKKQLRLLSRVADEKKFPKSRRLVAEDNKPYAPLGWIQIQQKPFDKMNKTKTQKQQPKDEDYQNTSDLSFEEKLALLKSKFGN